MNKHEVIDLGFTLGLMAVSAYLGYIWGTHRMATAYGEVMSAEAIMYLAARDSE